VRAAAALVLLLSGCAVAQRQAATPVAVRQGEFVVDVVTTAVVKPEEAHAIALPPGIWGGNLEWMAEEGVPVKQGAVVARISQRRVTEQLNDALDDLAGKQRGLERTQAADPVKRQEIASELLQREQAWREAELNREAARRGGGPDQLAAAQRDLAVAGLASEGSDAEVLADLQAKGVVARAEAEKARLDKSVAELDRRRARLALDQLAPGAKGEEVEKMRYRAQMAKAALDAVQIEAPAKRELLALEREKQQVDVRGVKKKVSKLRRKANSTQLVAPADGMLLYPVIFGWRKAHVGMEVWNGLTFMEVTKLTTVKLEGAVPEAEVALVRAGMAAEITADGWPDKVIAGKVTRVSQLAKESEERPGRPSRDDGVKRFDVTVVPVGKTPELKPNMRVKVRIVSERRAGATSVPADALFGKDDARFVWLAGAGGPVKQAVAVAATGRDWVALKAPLPPDAKVYLLDPTAPAASAAP
jgi:multidrug resistance efflux pump